VAQSRDRQSNANCADATIASVKVLFVTGIFPPDHGGPARYVPMVATELRRRNHDVLAVITLSDRLDCDDSGYGFPIVRLRRSLPRGWRMVQTIRSILRHGRSADVIYLNGLVFEGIVATRLLRHCRTAIKVVGDLIWEKARNSRVTTLDLDSFQFASLPISWRVMRRLQAWYTARADAVIVPSAYLKSIVDGWGVDPEKIRVIRNSVSLPPPGATAPRFDVITIARLVPWKGIAELIEVVSAAGWSLRIVGDGPLMAELNRLAEALSADVSFAGEVAADRIDEEIRSARVFVLNSSYEGLPHVVLEAKAAGVPVVCTAVGGTVEAVRDGVDGYLVSYGDKGLLRARIGELLASAALRQQMGEQGRIDIRDRFSIGRLLDETESALLELAR
jgi:glycosyltransferase involved in cell wall biosynthesis